MYQTVLQPAALTSPLRRMSIIISAGPVGLLKALKLGLNGISTIVLEKQRDILRAPRTTAYMPVVSAELRKMGVLQVISKKAFRSYSYPYWRRPNGDAIVFIDLAKIRQLQEAGNSPPDPMMDPETDCLYIIDPDQLSYLLLEQVHLRCKEFVSVRFNRPCLGVETVGDRAQVMTTDRLSSSRLGTDILLDAKWVIGADGAGSAVRQMCCIPGRGYLYGLRDICRALVRVSL